MNVKTIQEALRTEGFYKAAIDGIAGPKTRAAINVALSKRGIVFSRWNVRRRQNAYAQVLMKELDINVGPIDGLWGPQTKAAYKVWEELERTGEKPPFVLPPSTNWPRQRNVTRFFGARGTNQVLFQCPYPMRLAWDLDEIITEFSCNRKIRDPLTRIFQSTLDHYGIETIRELRLDRFSGCLAVRRMKGGRSWSMHSWGIAVDIDSEYNQFRWGRDRASLDDPEYDEFWGFVEHEGAISLGRERNFDWMHFQFARL